MQEGQKSIIICSIRTDLDLLKPLTRRQFLRVRSGYYYRGREAGMALAEKSVRRELKMPEALTRLRRRWKSNMRTHFGKVASLSQRPSRITNYSSNFLSYFIYLPFGSLHLIIYYFTALSNSLVLHVAGSGPSCPSSLVPACMGCTVRRVSVGGHD